MPGYVNGIPHATSTDRIDLWPTTSRNLAQWIDENIPRNDDPPAAHTHERLDLGGAVFKLNPAGGVEHHAEGSRRWLVDATGTLLEGTVPTSRVDGLAARLAALEFSSGLRDVSSLLRNGWVAGSITLARDRGAAVSLNFENLDASGSTGTSFMALPAGFRPRWHPGARSLRTVIGNGYPPVMYQIDVDGAGNVRIFVPNGEEVSLSGTLNFNTPDSTPSILPGDPA